MNTMNRLKLFLFPFVIIIVLTLLLVRTGAEAASSSGCGKWNLVSSPNVGLGMNGLAAVAVVPGTQTVWAVGSYTNSNGSSRTLIEQWNGTQWSVVASPNVGRFNNFLYGVTAVSAQDVWAVGFFDSSKSINTLTEHWNGTQWSVISSPNPSGSASNTLTGVTAISSNDVWAVGYSSLGGLTEHWNGTQWSVIANPSGKNILLNVSAVSANDIWAVGYYINSKIINKALIEHWDGTKWSIVAGPNAGNVSYTLFGVSAISTSDVWAVGVYYNTSNDFNKTLIEHWNGKKWSIVSSPTPGFGAALFSVSAVSANDIWTVGDYGSNSLNAFQTLIERWDGSNWSVVSSPNGSLKDSRLDAVSADSANDVWAVGGTDNPNILTSGRTLTEFFC
jgi:hypothetical protein